MARMEGGCVGSCELRVASCELRSFVAMSPIAVLGDDRVLSAFKSFRLASIFPKYYSNSSGLGLRIVTIYVHPNRIVLVNEYSRTVVLASITSTMYRCNCTVIQYTVKCWYSVL
jgi:hypothetical protein